MKKRKPVIEVVEDEELDALGRYFDEHQEETEAEFEQAKASGEAYTLAELGCSDAFEAGRKLLTMRASKKAKGERKMYSFRLPVFVVAGLKEKAKAQHVPYQRFVNEVLARAAN
jgi:predicted DNA binding CopG/RHH family protein